MSLRVALTLAFLVALSIGSYLFGRHVLAGEIAAQQLDDALQYARLVRQAQGASDALAAELEAARAARAPRERIIIREVVRYEQIVSADRRCMLDGAWRLLHDAAATGTPAESARLADDSAPPASDAAALETVAENYADCRENAVRLTALQKWVGGAGNSGEPGE